MRNAVIDRIIDGPTIGELVPVGSTIIVGFSGGPDSSCLLHALVQLSDVYNLTIVPVHVNHMLRPEAHEEAMHCAEICDRYDLECLLYEADCQGMADDLGISTEEAGRNIRYEIFDDVAEELEEQGVDPDNIFIALAHNADDQSETVLFRLLRGTGLHGLAGIPYARSSAGGYMVVRPLLDIPRSDIEEYCRANKLRPNIDKSNSSNDYTRNRIRNELIPYLEKNYNPNIKSALRRFAMLAERDDTVLLGAAVEIALGATSVTEDETALILDITELRDNPTAINSRIIEEILVMLQLGDSVSCELLDELVLLIYSDNPSASIDLPRGYKALREYDRIIFTDNESWFNTAPADIHKRIIPQIIMRREYREPYDEAYAAFDFDSFNGVYPGRIGDIVLRHRQEGDFIAIKNGNKKLQDFLVDAKVKKKARDNILLACIDNEVLWILPDEELPTEAQRAKGRFSQNFQITDTTERVLFLEVEDII